MDTKRLIWVTALSVTVMFAWMIGVNYVGRYLGYDMSPAPQKQPAATTRPVIAGDNTTDRNADTKPLPPGTTRPAGAAPADVGKLRVVAAAATNQTVKLGSAEPKDPTYALQLTLTNVGAGIDEVLLNDFKQKVEKPARYAFQEPYANDPADTRPLASTRVTVAGETVDLSRVAWKLDAEQSDATQATFYVDLAGEDGPVARVSKLFKIYPRQTTDAPGRFGYEVLVRQTIKNLTGKPLVAAAAVNGPVTPPREIERGYDRTIIAGYRGKNGTIDYKGFQAESFYGDDRRKDLLHKADEPPLLWAGANTVYFDAIVRPMPLAVPQTGGEVSAPDWLKAVIARGTNPDPDKPDDISRDEPNVAMTFESADLQIAADGDAQMPFRVLFAPKDRQVLKSDYYASAAMRYDETLQSPFGCTWFVFTPVVDVLVFLLTFFHTILRDWGLAIIALVVVVRSLLHPITKRSQRSMARMSKFGPEMERLKKKYGDDKDAMSKAMGEFYREHGLAALPLGCLPMFLQTPIWIALYSTLQAEFRLRQEPFLDFFGIHFTWINDLARPDALVDFGRPIPILFFTIHAVNLLPLLLAVVFYFQMKFQPQPVAATPEQQSQQKLMKWVMVLMFPLFLYKAPSGLNLYIITSTVIGIFESKRIRDQLKAEEAAKPVEIESPTVPAKTSSNGTTGTNGRRGGAAVATAPATGWRGKLASFQEKVQAQVEQAQKNSAKRPGNKKR